MNDSQIRVRFAPSPTGFLHVGGARTALFNWLFARRHDGVFVLRIEDTDRARSDDAMTAVILDSLQWLGLNWDEGPYHQADGVERHRQDAHELLAQGRAYRCFCTPDEMAARRNTGAENEAFRYDRRCLLSLSTEESQRRAAAGAAFTIRFQVPEGTTAWDDVVHGRIEFDNADIEDFIILRSDGTPIYNLAVVSDDIAMTITHVLRGDDHISNTPKQILLYQGLGAELPVFGHLPMILGSDGKRLSKRHGATAVGEYQAQGILASAMVNFLALLGWNPGTDEEIFTVDELVHAFSLDAINRKSAIFDTKKLEWLNGQHLNRMSAEQLEPMVAERLVSAGLTDAESLRARSEWLRRLIELLSPRARSIGDIVHQAGPYLSARIEYDREAIEKHWRDPATVERLEAVRRTLAATSDWSESSLEAELRGLAEKLGVGAGKLIHPLRVAVTGSAASPGMFEVLVALGQALVLQRLDDAISLVRKGLSAGPVTQA